MTNLPNPVERFLLVKLMEECAEVIQACSKILEHGFDGHNTELPTRRDGAYDNKLDLVRELGDVLAVMHILCERVRPHLRVNAFKHAMIESFAEAKRDRLRTIIKERRLDRADLE